MATTKKSATTGTTTRSAATGASAGKSGAARPRRAAGSGTTTRSADGRALVIVESPAKAKTIARYLGSGYVVEASFGHVRDLPQKDLGVDVDHGFAPQYEVPADKAARVRSLKALVSGANAVYLATDPDREGEAIAWHVQQVTGAGRGGQPVYRVEFHEITQSAIQRAVSNPRSINSHVVDAQQARRVLDRLVGYMISPVLWDKVQRGLSAGRVQSVAVRMVVEREREIRVFVPEEYWTVEADLSKRPRGDKANAFHAQLLAVGGKKAALKNADQANEVVAALKGAVWVVEKVTTRETQRRPAPPFITSTLQQEASRKLNMPAKKTMKVAQELYEGVGSLGGLITYMRTDSTNVAAEAQQEARAVISERFGPQYAPASPPVYAKKVAGAQEAHEAVRPTHVSSDPEQIKDQLNFDQLRLYTLIWRRFVASQMANAIFDQTTADIGAGPAASSAPRPYTFRATGSVIKFLGFLAVYREGRDAGDGDDDLDKDALPVLTRDEALDLLKLWPEQHFTQPPPRFTEPTLVKALEEKGIGRPSTYATILSTIQDRGYVALGEKKFEPTPLGEVVNDLLVSNFSRIVDIGFTATMEAELDEIAGGKRAWLPVISNFYGPLEGAIAQAKQNLGRVEVAGGLPPRAATRGRARREGSPAAPRREVQSTGEKCPQSGHDLVIRQSQYGPFIACSGYPKCKYTRRIEDGQSTATVFAQAPVTAPVTAPVVTEPAAPPVRRRRTAAAPEQPASPPAPIPAPVAKAKAPQLSSELGACPKCGSPMVARQSQYGPFIACSGFPKCRYIQKDNNSA